MDKNTLTMVGMWAQSRVASGEEPPWTFHKLKQLVDITNDLVEGMDATAVFDVSSISPAPVPDNVVQIDQFRPAKADAEVALPT